MRRILCMGIALIMLLTACSAPNAELDGECVYGIYEFAFAVEELSGGSLGDWDVAYAYNGVMITGGHQITFPLGVFSFHSIQVHVMERDAPNNKYSATFPVAICDGGTGKTEITVTDSNGETATFKITCQVIQVGKQ